MKLKKVQIKNYHKGTMLYLVYFLWDMSLYRVKVFWSCVRLFICMLFGIVSPSYILSILVCTNLFQFIVICHVNTMYLTMSDI